MGTFLQDVRYGLRTLRHSPGFAVVTVLTLALAIGVNTAIYSLIDVVFFSDLPFQETDRLGFVWSTHPERGLVRQGVSLPDFLDIREGVTAVSDMTGIRQGGAILTGEEEPVRVFTADTTANVFDVWGIQPLMGRGFLEGEDRPGAEPVAVLSHGTWQERFAGDPDIVGQVVKIDGVATTIVGVMSQEVEFGDLARVEIWRPMTVSPDAAPRDRRDLWVTLRLAPGASLERARQEIAAVVARLETEYPETNRGWGVNVQSFDEGLADRSFWTLLFLLSLTVAFVMLLACSNIANLTLARTSQRARELAVRVAMGAGRMRLVRQLLVEGAVLSLAAGLLGLLVARGTLDLMVWMAGDNSGVTFVFRMLELDRSVLAFTLIVSLLAPLLFALVPAVRVTRENVAGVLKEGGGRTSGDLAGLRGRRALVVVQVALALSLMLVAGVLIRSIIDIRAVDLGYDPAAVLTARVDLPASKYPEKQDRERFFREAIERVRALPQIESAAWASRRLYADDPGYSNLIIDGRPAAEEGRLPWAYVVAIDPEYLEVMEIAPLRGRTLGASDGAEAAPVALVNREAARRYWPEGDPLGDRFRLPGRDGEGWIQVVGVVSNVAALDADSPARPIVYVPREQRPQQGLALVARPLGDVMAAAGPIREAIWSVDPEQPVSDVRTMAQIVDDVLAGFNSVLSLFALFAAFALIMAASGIYAVISFSVSRRIREFGIRMALGAQAAEVRTLVARQSAVLVAIGLGVGLLGGYAIGRVLSSGIAAVDGTDPLTFIVVPLLLALVAAVSALVPAHRATRVDPMIALRTE